ncbi:lamin tail domain-containing protein, partial [Candidatus Wolfebacteria bacterium]|nr:lamin tail domain-containing protein [Candidatus Wolfebacteria bacterium]
FIDTDNNAHDFEIQTCPSPKTQSQVCQTSQLNQAPTQLGANHIVIGEIQIAGDKADDEFIEIYNPTDNAVSLTDYSIQYLSGTATSTNKINKKNFSNNGEIAAKSFYLLVNSSATSSLKNKADMTYSAFSLSGNSNGATIFLVSTTIVISGVNDPAIIDGVSYGNPVLNVFATTSTMPAANQSFERKAFSNGACVSAQNDGEFLGNGCDADSGIDFSAEGGPASDWEIRNIPNPQNSSNFPEPRTSPTAPENFAIEYASSSLSLNLTWGSSQDYSGSNSAIIYKITDASASSTFPAIETTSTTVAISLDENNFGKNYLFSIQAFDKGGLSSKSSQKEISIPNSILIIAQQLDKSIFDQGTGNGEFFQKLGNGLTGSPDSVAFHAGLPSTPTHGSAYDIRVEFWESDNDSYDNLKRVSYNHCQPTDGWRPIIDPNCPNLNFEFGVDKDYTIPVREAFVFDPNKYYKIRFVTYQSYAVFYGSGAEDSYVYGEAAKDNGGGAEISSSIKDLYFIIKSRPPIELPVSISLLAPQNFNVDFNPDNSELVFNWDKPRYFNDSGSSTLIYQITDISVPSSTLPMIQAGDYSAASPIEEVGRDYQFSIKAVDENGQNSVSVKKSITLPHLLINPYIIASQINVSSSIEGSYNGEVSQNLGSGLAGKLGAVTFRAKFGRPPLSIRVDMYESDDSGYGNPRKIERATECGVDISSNCFGQKIENGVEKDYTIPATKDYVFDPAKYYKFEIITYQAGDKPLFFGSGGDLYFIITSRTPL